MHKLQSLFYLTSALHVSGVTITRLQEHKTTVTTATGKRYTLIDKLVLIFNQSIKNHYLTTSRLEP
jgi:hypothetical protein